MLLARALAGMGATHWAVEDPGLPPHRAILQSHGAQLTALAVDEHGARVRELAQIERAAGGRFAAALVTPAHQSPTGVALAPARRSALLEWATEGRVVIEDDYDAEYRYDRAPLAALQGLAPDRVVYLGTASKTLAPALRLGWMVLPPRLLGPIIEQKVLADNGCPTLEQLTLAQLLDSGAYDRHLRQARRRYRARRDALVEAVRRHLPTARVIGLAAGLHATVRLGHEVNGHELIQAAARQSVGVYPLGYCFMELKAAHHSLVLGYANLTEQAIDEGIRRLARALAEVGASSSS